MDTFDREYDIRVLQYDVTNQMGGPPGCLQFFLGPNANANLLFGGTVSSFGWTGITTSMLYLIMQKIFYRDRAQGRDIY